MIGKIKGTLSEIDGNIALIETSSGVYYQVYLSLNLLSSLQIPCDIEVYTYHHIREDTQLLFGFKDKKLYRLFRLLLGVSGVGPKTAFNILSMSSPEELVTAVQKNDVAYFKKIKGLGKKTALKILIELSQKFNTEFTLEPEKIYTSDEQTIIDALISLGFLTKEVKRILTELDEELSVEEKIKQAIRLLSK